MRTSNAFIAIVFLAAATLLFLFGLSALEPLPQRGAATDTASSAPPLERPHVDFANPQIGPVSAPVTIVEFGDYSCAPCAAMSGDLAKLVADYKDKVRLVWKDFPNSSLHPDASAEAEAARCAGLQGAFWKYHDLLFANPGTSGTANFSILAQTVGVDAAAFSDCMTSHTAGPTVQRDYDEGLRLRIDATPYLFVNARRVSGALTYDQLKPLIDAELAK